MATKYIEYELDENQFVKIPKEEIERLMKGLGCSEDDACWIWCEDNGKIINEEQEEFTGQVGDEQVLQILQETHSPQRNKVSGGYIYG